MLDAEEVLPDELLGELLDTDEVDAELALVAAVDELTDELLGELTDELLFVLDELVCSVELEELVWAVLLDELVWAVLDELVDFDELDELVWAVLDELDDGEDCDFELLDELV